MKHIFLSPVFLAALATQSVADPTAYGSLRHYDELPGVLFLVGAIETNDSFELRRAMRDHEVKTLVTASAGGNLYEGLQMASILHDRGISTYVPEGVNCESSCANVFIGGAKRAVFGELGVHQFFSGYNTAQSTTPMDVTTSVTQYTTADIIGILNEFGTPPFVYEKMFGTADIYYFSAPEKMKINLGLEDPAFQDPLETIDAFIASNPAAIARPETPKPTVSIAAESTPSVTQPSTLVKPERYKDIDFFGADISAQGVRGVSLLECDDICKGDSRCAAYSYVVETRWCWPKYSVSNLSMAPGTISGIHDFAKVDLAIFDRPFIEATGTDITGFDIFPAGLKNTSLDLCRSACAASNSCVAFTWVSKKNWCFPKYGVGQLKETLGAISGVKN